QQHFLFPDAADQFAIALEFGEVDALGEVGAIRRFGTHGHRHLLGLSLEKKNVRRTFRPGAQYSFAMQSLANSSRRVARAFASVGRSSLAARSAMQAQASRQTDFPPPLASHCATQAPT